MSGRCISCNSILTRVELLNTKEDGSVEDMCGDCKYEAFDESYNHKFLLEDAEEGVTKAKECENY